MVTNSPAETVPKACLLSGVSAIRRETVNGMPEEGIIVNRPNTARPMLNSPSASAPMVRDRNTLNRKAMSRVTREKPITMMVVLATDFFTVYCMWRVRHIV